MASAIRLGIILCVSQLPWYVLAHPCEAEKASACPDTPAEELGECLKDSSQHEAETQISSECQDFIALNKACSEDIQRFCDEGYFTDEVTPCLQALTDEEGGYGLSDTCKNVMKWAVPASDEGEDAADDGPSDELGMTDKDRAEKAEWQKKRKAVREEAIGRMKMKDVDRKKEEDRVALEKFKEESPEEYEAMMKQQEEEKKQQAEFKRKERMRMAAIQRAKEEAAGTSSDDTEDTGGKKKKKAKKGTGDSGVSSVVMTLAKLLLFAGVIFGIYCFTKFMGSQSTGKRSSGGGKAGKKKR